MSRKLVLLSSHKEINDRAQSPSVDVGGVGSWAGARGLVARGLLMNWGDSESSLRTWINMRCCQKKMMLSKRHWNMKGTVTQNVVPFRSCVFWDDIVLLNERKEKLLPVAGRAETRVSPLLVWRPLPAVAVSPGLGPQNKPGPWGCGLRHSPGSGTQLSWQLLGWFIVLFHLHTFWFVVNTEQNYFQRRATVIMKFNNIHHASQGSRDSCYDLSVSYAYECNCTN